MFAATHNGVPVGVVVAEEAQSISDVVHGTYGPTSMKVNGVTYTLTYSSGKISTVVGGGKTKTYTWSGDNLVSLVVT